MKKQQSGFSVIEGLLILVILAILGFTGWYVYHSSNQTDNSLSSANNSSQTSAVLKNLTDKNGKAATKKTVTSCDLALSIANKQGAAGTIHEDLVFTNKGSSNCTLNGYPTVTLLDSGGKTMGQAAAHDTSVSASQVTVKPGGAAYASLSLPNQVTGTSCSKAAAAQIQAVIPGLNLTLKTADTADTYCSGFMTRPFSANPSA